MGTSFEKSKNSFLLTKLFIYLKWKISVFNEKSF